MAALRVLLVDDDPFTRVTLATTIQAQGFDVVADADSVTTALRCARTTTFDIAVIDLDLGEGPTGIDLARALRRRQPDVGLVMLSTYEEPRLRGYDLPPLPPRTTYLVKRTVSDPSVLGRALRASVVDDAPDALPMSESGALVQPPNALKGLSDQQIEIMRLIAAGLTNAEIARRRTIEERSVEKAVARIARHFGLPASRERNQRVLIAQTYAELTGVGRARHE